ncbi:hypothetical protein GUITHDRAFT_164342 [Guillardia theta CCMP2712]|uniref:Uncharacterized protein n=1 Tax=Guillardia theta (strain CCMP2712) TaxID=905079 RepID=L1IZW1_GUITC|nr:hypothetical protein GUITHDRAFT_164342 [Guillardia theta CCMP2712]EKX41632.1 hypothetical protein GUITHDRAFT_164342 [Guillardia theta CCMP2712]|eukprot:XP_005828612.1 hypothetical protein GUITHDRAFT_164342 [Guillardia theta CCMP2712]
MGNSSSSNTSRTAASNAVDNNLIADEDGSMVPAYEGDYVKVRDLESVTTIKRFDGQAIIIAEDKRISCSQAQLVYDGVTLARKQLRLLLQLYSTVCEGESVVANVSIVSSIQKCIRSAHRAPDRQTLNFSECNLRDVDIILFARSIQNFHFDSCSELHITKIDLSYNEISGEGAVALGEIINKIGTVEELLLDRNKIGEAIQKMSPDGLESIKFLSVSGNRIKKLQALPPMPGLQTLILDWNPLQNNLSPEIFSECTSLVSLSLCSTALSNLPKAFAAISHLTNLRHLHFQSNRRGFRDSSAEMEENIFPFAVRFLERSNDYNIHTDDMVEDGFSQDSDGADALIGRLRDFVPFEDRLEHEEPIRGHSRSPTERSAVESRDTDAISYTANAQTDENVSLPTGQEDDQDEELNDLVDAGMATLNVVEEPRRTISVSVDADERETFANFLHDGVIPDLFHVNLLCSERHYREYIIAQMPWLETLDKRRISNTERAEARKVFLSKFEKFAYNRLRPINCTLLMRMRELGLNSADRRPLSSSLTTDSEAPASLSSPAAAGQPPGAQPSTRMIAPSHLRPRQFEYHPTKPEELVIGTVNGEVIVLNHFTGSILGQATAAGPPHSILGLCWLRLNDGLLISGSDSGNIQLYDVNLMKHSRAPTIYKYENFEHLTSLHIDCLDDKFLVSGYSNDVALYDLKVGKKIQTFKSLHSQHINVLKFANFSPSLFATSSFDKDVKMWDLREGANRPIFTCRSDQGNVMVCFSPDDRYLLSSAVDNEVRQYMAVDGRLTMKFDILCEDGRESDASWYIALGSEHNYTRSYYMNGSDYIISGSCEESVVRIYCARTGRFFRDFTIDRGSGPASLYVQSLRGDPFHPFHLSVLVAYNHPLAPSEMLEVNLLSRPDPMQVEPSYLAA